MSETVADQGWSNAFATLFGVNAIVWLGLYAAWKVSTEPSAQSSLHRADTVILAAVALTCLLPSPVAAAMSGLAAALWLFATSQGQSTDRRLAFILFALTGQMVFGRLFLALFSETILTADVALVSYFSATDTIGNVMQNSNGDSLVVFAGCSSVGNMSYAILAWVCVVQLLRLKVDRRLILWTAGSLAMIFVVNSVRLAMLAAMPEHFAMLHHGTGAMILAWVNLLLLAAMIGAASLGAAARQGRLSTASAR